MNYIIHPNTGEKINIFSKKGKYILKKYIKFYTQFSGSNPPRRSSRFKRQRHEDEVIETIPYKKIKTGPVEYTFNINPTIVNEIFNLMEDGNNDEPVLVNYTDKLGKSTGEQYLLKGTERGGHFIYNKNDETNTIDIVGYELANFLPGTTSLNSGDFPFTFHTHPIVIKDDIEVDNYPNLISDDDFIGVIMDNFFCKFPSNRNMCNNKVQEKNVGGISIFDIVAVPYGLFVYLPSQSWIYKHSTKTEKFLEKKFKRVLQKSIKYLNQYSIDNKNNYYDWESDKAGIRKYLTLLKRNGIDAIFFDWDKAKRVGMQFKIDLPSNSIIDTEMCGKI